MFTLLMMGVVGIVAVGLLGLSVLVGIWNKRGESVVEDPRVDGSMGDSK